MDTQFQSKVATVFDGQAHQFRKLVGASLMAVDWHGERMCKAKTVASLGSWAWDQAE